MNGGSVEKFWHKVAKYTEGLRDGNERANALQRHHDAMALWIIGMAAGAVIVGIETLSRWVLAIALGPFALVVVIGVPYRLVMAELIEKDHPFGFKKINTLEAFQLHQFEDVKSLDQLEDEFEAIQEDKVSSLPKLYKDLNKWQGYENRLRPWLYILFAIGVITTAIIAVFAPVCTPVASQGDLAVVQVVRVIDGDTDSSDPREVNALGFCVSYSQTPP